MYEFNFEEGKKKFNNNLWLGSEFFFVNVLIFDISNIIVYIEIWYIWYNCIKEFFSKCL